jgi:predicted regulator of Ras-like GTPase activity (Roadblock/LC7/MglB family)
MARLTEVVGELAGREGVQAVVVVSGDGLAIQQVARDSLDADSLAALTTSVVQYASRLGTGVGAGAFRTAVLEYEQRVIIIAQVGVGESFAILAAPDADVGHLLYDLRQQRPALAALF